MNRHFNAYVCFASTVVDVLFSIAVDEVYFNGILYSKGTTDLCSLDSDLCGLQANGESWCILHKEQNKQRITREYELLTSYSLAIACITSNI